MAEGIRVIARGNGALVEGVRLHQGVTAVRTAMVVGIKSLNAVTAITAIARKALHEIVTLAVTGKEAQGTEAEASSFGAKQATPLLKFLTVWPRAKGALREDEKIKDVSQFRTERDDEMRGPHLRHV